MAELLNRADIWIALLGVFSGIWSVFISAHLARGLDRSSLLPKLTAILAGMAVLLAEVALRAQREREHS